MCVRWCRVGVRDNNEVCSLEVVLLCIVYVVYCIILLCCVVLCGSVAVYVPA